MLLAQLCAWYVSIALKGTEFASYVSSSLALSDNLPVLGISLVVSFAAALIAGSFPAWYITSFNPAMAAKGVVRRLGGRPPLPHGAARRAVHRLHRADHLLGLHAPATAYVRRFDLGFDHERILAFDFPRRKLTNPDSFDTFASSLQTDPQIAGVTASGNRFVAEAISVFGRKVNGEEVGIHVRFVRSNFLDVLGIPVLAGEAFKPEHDRDSTARFIVNDLLARKGLKVGDRLDPGVVIGICPDFHYRPLQYTTEPFAFVTGTCWQTRMSRFYVRLAAGFDLDAVCEGIQEKARTFDPGSEVSDFRFFDEEINVQYARERRIATIVGLFTVLAVAIALMGSSASCSSRRSTGVVRWPSARSWEPQPPRFSASSTAATWCSLRSASSLPRRRATGLWTAGSRRLPTAHRSAGGYSPRPLPSCCWSRSPR